MEAFTRRMVINTVLLYSTENYAECPEINHRERNIKKESCVCV